MKEIALAIPAFNSHDTIRKLLHSVCMFKFVDKLDILIIDDFSEEPYDYLIDAFPELSLTIIRLETNYGPGRARNLGIDWALEKSLPYIMFADSDDFFISIDFWDLITEEQRAENQLFIFNFFDESADSKIRDLDVWCFGKIYKTEIIKAYNIRFSENYSNEDVIFNFVYIGVTENVYLNDALIYFWHARANSLSRTNNYVYDSLSELVYNLTNTFNDYRSHFSEARALSIIVNRMIRLYYHVNELLFTYPDLFKKDYQDLSIFQAVVHFYKECYMPLEDQITAEQIFQEFEEIGQGGTILRNFIWIDYFSFIDMLKENAETTVIDVPEAIEPKPKPQLEE